jgi:AmmeMemoRadiSam system protein A
MSIDRATRDVVLSVARTAIASAIGARAACTPADAAVLHERRGVFVTLKHRGRLRGCMGRVEPDEPLTSLLPAVAVLSATADPRFAPVTADELSEIEIEVSLLTEPVAITGPGEVEIGRHGLIVAGRGRRGLLLPQVAAEHGWTASEFLAQTCLKARLSADAWRQPGILLQAFEAEIVE